MDAIVARKTVLFGQSPSRLVQLMIYFGLTELNIERTFVLL
jgi:hypothetical protein